VTGPFLSAIGIDSFGNCIAVDAESVGGVCDALSISRESFLNIELFEFCQSLVQHYPAIQHIIDHCFQAGAYLHSLLQRID